MQTCWLYSFGLKLNCFLRLSCSDGRSGAVYSLYHCPTAPRRNHSLPRTILGLTCNSSIYLCCTFYDLSTYCASFVRSAPHSRPRYIQVLLQVESGRLAMNASSLWSLWQLLPYLTAISLTGSENCTVDSFASFTS